MIMTMGYDDWEHLSWKTQTYVFIENTNFQSTLRDHHSGMKNDKKYISLKRTKQPDYCSQSSSSTTHLMTLKQQRFDIKLITF